MHSYKHAGQVTRNLKIPCLGLRKQRLQQVWAVFNALRAEDNLSKGVAAEQQTHSIGLGAGSKRMQRLNNLFLNCRKVYPEGLNKSRRAIKRFEWDLDQEGMICGYQLGGCYEHDHFMWSVFWSRVGNDSGHGSQSSIILLHRKQKPQNPLRSYELSNS